MALASAPHAQVPAVAPAFSTCPAAHGASPIDAPPTPPPPPGTARELTVVGGAVADSRFRFEVEIVGGIASGSTRDATHQFDNALTVTLPQGAN